MAGRTGILKTEIKRFTYQGILLSILLLVLSGCGSGTPTSSTPTLPPTRPVIASRTPGGSTTPAHIATPLMAITPLPTLEPTQAYETIKAMMHGQVECDLPCIWGIIPGQTTIDEARQIINHLGMNLMYTNSLGEKEFCETSYRFDTDLSISPLLTIQDGTVLNLRIYIHPEISQPGNPREWLAYSPESLITQYGLPSKVEFFLGRVSPTYAMTVSWREMDFIVEYHSRISGFNGQVCPLSYQYDSVVVWMGKNPEHPPAQGVPLETATSLTISEFARKMIGSSEPACFMIDPQMFP